MNKIITDNIFCTAYGHNYFRLSHPNTNTPELICKCCKNYFKYDNNGNIHPVFDEKNEKLSSFLYIKETA